MFITISLAIEKERFDLQIDSKQQIKDILEVLNSSGKMSCAKIPDFFRSNILQRAVSSYKTFEEEKIYSGDILTAIF